MKKALIYSHQAWTDTINLLGLTGYYSKKYDEVKVVVIDKMYQNVSFFTKNIKNVEILEISEEDHDLEKTGQKDIYIILKEHNVQIDEYDILIHGWSDWRRSPTDKHRSVYGDYHNNYGQIHPVRGLYHHYDIDYNNRIYCFDIQRDHELEDETYNNFLEKNGKENYILYHSDPSRNFGVPIRVPNYDSNKKYINLSGLAGNIFSTIKILENSEEMHLIDSVWASFCYILDAKYGLFSNKQIYVYPLFNRVGGCLFQAQHPLLYLDPVNLPNWKIIKNYF